MAKASFKIEIDFEGKFTEKTFESLKSKAYNAIVNYHNKEGLTPGTHDELNSPIKKIKIKDDK